MTEFEGLWKSFERGVFGGDTCSAEPAEAAPALTLDSLTQMMESLKTIQPPRRSKSWVEHMLFNSPRLEIEPKASDDHMLWSMSMTMAGMMIKRPEATIVGATPDYLIIDEWFGGVVKQALDQVDWDKLKSKPRVKPVHRCRNAREELEARRGDVNRRRREEVEKLRVRVRQIDLEREKLEIPDAGAFS